MEILKIIIMILPYLFLAFLGYVIANFLPRNNPSQIGIIIACAGAVFTIVNAFFSKIVDEDTSVIDIGNLNSRQSIDLEKCINRRSKFLKIRYLFSLTVYILVLIGGIVISMFDITKINIIYTNMLFALLFSGIPAILTFTYAHFDIVEMKRKLKISERKNREKEEAIKDLNKIQ